MKNELESTFGLSNYAIAKRYPGEYQKISLHESKEAVEAAKKIKETVLKLFKKDKFDIASITPYN